MYRALLLNPIFIALLAAMALLAARMAGYHADSRNCCAAAAIAAISVELALLPLLFTRGQSQAVVSQAALATTVLHLLACAGLGIGASALLHLGQPFLYWLLGFYWTSLLGICVVAVRTVKSSPIHVPPVAAPRMI